MDGTAEPDAYSILLSAGQSVSLVATSDDPPLQLQLALADSNEAVVSHSEAASPGESVVLQNVPVDEDGRYSIQVQDLHGGAGDYTLHVWINAAVEEEPFTDVANGTLSTAQDVDSAFASLPEQPSVERATVVGTSSPGLQEPTYFASGDVPVAVGAAQVTSSLTIPDDQIIDELTVRLDIEHSYVEDIEVYLVSPQGTEVPLFAALPGAGDERLDAVFDDAAAVSINDAVPPYDGSTDGSGGVYRPVGNLADFGGENAAGVWTLVVNDTYPLDDGTLNGWGLEIVALSWDTDIYQFTAAAGQAISAAVEGVASYTLLELLDSDGTVLVESAGTEEPRLDFVAPGEGTYFVRVTAAEGYLLNVAVVSHELMPGDADGDGDADGADFLAWQLGFGTTHGARLGDGNFDGDEDTDGDDLAIWQVNFGTQVDGDADEDGDVDGADFLAWQLGFGMTHGAQLGDDDFDGDEDVDGGDLLIWQATFGTGEGGGGSAASVREASRVAAAQDSVLRRTERWIGRRPGVSPQLDAALKSTLIDAEFSNFLPFDLRG